MLVDRQRPPEPPPLRHIAYPEPRDARRTCARDIFAADADRTAARTEQAHDGVAERGLAHAVAADHREHALLERQVDALQRMRMPVINVETPDLQRGRGAADIIHGRLRDRVPAPRDPTRSPAAGPP